MDRLLISRIFQMIGWSLWAFLKLCNQIINAETCSTIRNRGEGTHEDSLRFYGESQDYFFTAGFALGLWCWVRGTKGEQPLCKHLMSSLWGGLSCQWQWCETWSIISWAFQRREICVEICGKTCVCLEWGVGDCLLPNRQHRWTIEGKFRHPRSPSSPSIEP